MGYTYDNIVEEANKAGVYDKFTQQDLAVTPKNPEYGMALLGLMKNLSSATTQEQQVLTTEYINRLRKNYGVTGTVASSAATTATEPQRLLVPEKTGQLDSSNPTTYKAVLDDLINQKEFTYDPAKDPTYAAYAQMYQREGERAVANTLAKAAAMTGGRPSSYAISAAQQTGSNYAAALADMIPTLRQNAYSEYLQNIEAKRAIAEALQGSVSEEQTERTQEVLDRIAQQARGGAFGAAASLLNGGSVGMSSTPTGGALPAVLGILNGYKGSTGTSLVPANGNEQSGEGESEQTGDTAEDPTILNEHGDGWVIVGDLRMNYRTLLKSVEDGTVLGVYDAETNSVYYTLVPPKYVAGSQWGR